MPRHEGRVKGILKTKLYPTELAYKNLILRCFKTTLCFTLFQAKIRIMFVDAIVLAQFAIQGKCVTFGA